MNITKSLFALLIAGATFTGCKESAKEPATASTETATKTDAPQGKIDSSASEQAVMQTASFSIDGMTCAIGCAKTIESKLSGMDGVKKASVDFDKKSATVEFDSAKLNPEKIAEAVEATAGGKTYKVSNMKSSGDKAMLVNKDKNKKAKAEKPGEKKSCDKDGKPACCSGKKPCHGEKAAM